MIASMSAAAGRGRQAAALAGPAARVLNWQPLAQVMLAAIVFVTIGSRAGVPLRLSIASAAVAASSAFLLDDPAAVTLAASPTSLPLRRLQRVAIAALAVGLWWTAAVAVTTHRAGGLPLQGRALELSMLLAVALAVSATTSTIGDRTAGGIAGAVFTIVCYAITYLPSQTWLPLPTHPDTPGSTTPLLAVLACALALLARASRDPAHQRPRRQRTTGQHHSARQTRTHR